MPTTQNNENMKKSHPTTNYNYNNANNDDDGNINDNELLLHHYQNAIDCIVECESIIKTLQYENVTKDEQIKTLEEKLVKMSFEFASSKALEDEHRLLLTRNITSDDGNRHTSNHNVNDGVIDDDSERPPSAQVVRRNKLSSSHIARTGSGQSLTVRVRPLVHGSSCIPNIGNISSSITHPNTSRGMYLKDTPTTLDITKPNDRTWQGSLGESFISRRLSNISHYFLGSNKNDEVASAESDTTRAKRISREQSGYSWVGGREGLILRASSKGDFAGCFCDASSRHPKSVDSIHIDWPEF
mmetsp:Transcript_35172/g.74213  ORF Transcript_35172/g.74213 Transcript_35172/m.74213 type:complete len:299 (-) Transcript_35172:176-1072(-)